jgi:hypothetical protein
MRPKIAFIIIAAGFFAVAALLVLGPHSSSGVDGTEHSDATTGATPDGLGGTITGSGSGQRPLLPPKLPETGSRRLYAARSAAKTSDNLPDRQEIALTPEQQEDAINDRILELSDLATRGDSASLGIILSELSNDNSDIRRAALDAVMQSGNSEAVPALQQLAQRSADPQQQAELAQAIEFLTLPSISDLAATRGTLTRSRPLPVPRPAPFGRQ